MNSVFITGTDTGVGKTVVCGLLAGYLRSHKVSVVTQKWIQSGTQTGDNDLREHTHWAGDEDPSWAEHAKDRMPYQFSLPASPHLAARWEDRQVDTKEIVSAYLRLSEAYDSVLVEGIGGLLVPLCEESLVVDLVRDLGLVTLVVVANKLGAINHALLTVEALRARDITILGLVFCDVPDQDPEVSQDNPQIIQRHTGVRVLGRVPWIENPEDLRAAFEPAGQTIHFAMGY